MKRPVTAFVLALASVILCPILVFIEFTALFGAAMITYEPTNPLWVKIISVVVVFVIGLVALAVPVLVVIMGSKARAAVKSTTTKGTGLATAAMVIAGIVTAGVVVTQVYLVFMIAGVCSLEGC
jgi:hypothetical protein